MALESARKTSTNETCELLELWAANILIIPVTASIFGHQNLLVSGDTQGQGEAQTANRLQLTLSTE